LPEYWISVLVITGINIIAVLGVTLLLGFTGLFTWGHAAYMGVGGYVAALMTLRLHTPFFLSLAGGIAAAVLVAVPIGYPTLKLRGDYFIVGTLGASEVVILLIENLHWITGGSRGLPGIPIKTTPLLTLVMVAFSIWMVRNYVKYRHGRNCIAIRENELAAACIGINTFRYKMEVLIISAALAGLSGGLLAHYVGLLHPRMFGIWRSTDLTIMVILGGLGSITGSVVATVLLTILPEFLRFTAEWRLVVYGLAVTFVMIFRPQGLLGYREMSTQTLRSFYRRKGLSSST